MAEEKTLRAWDDDFWDNWWEEDFSWAGLENKPLVGWHVNHAGTLYKGEKREQSDLEANLQDYWQHHGINPDTDLIEIQTRDKSGTITGRKKFTALHLPYIDGAGKPTEKVSWGEDEQLLYNNLLRQTFAKQDERIPIPTCWDGIVVSQLPDLTHVPIRVIHSASYAHLAHHYSWNLYDFRIGTNFKNAAFDGRSNFVGINFSGKTSFEQATFGDVVSFNKSEFDQNVDFRNTTYTSLTIFSHVKLSNNVDFDNAFFKKEVSFESAKFHGVALFNNVGFNGKVKFQKAHFNGNVVFALSNFRQDTDFQQVTFEKSADFKQITFEKYVEFDNAVFKQDADFSSTTFTGNACFNDVIFTQHATFNRAIFTDEAIFENAVFDGESNLEETYFRKNANFSSTKNKDKSEKSFGNMNFSGAIFDGDAAFDHRLFQGNFNLSGVQFNGIATFHGCALNSGFSISGTAFNVHLSSANTYKIPPLSDDILLKIHHADNDKSSVFQDFKLKWHKIRITNIEENTPTKPQLNNFLTKLKSNPNDRVPIINKNDKLALYNRRWDDIERSFQALKLGMESLSRQGEAHHFYRLELLARRKRIFDKQETFWEKLASKLYQLTSDFGNSIIRPIISVTIMFIISAIVYLAIAGCNNSKLYEGMTLEIGAPIHPSVHDAFAMSGKALIGPLNYAIPKFKQINDTPKEENTVMRTSLQSPSIFVRGLTHLILIFQSVFSFVMLFFTLLALRRRFQIN